ncbi:unnamed protein product [Lampetra planeri]
MAAEMERPDQLMSRMLTLFHTQPTSYCSLNAAASSTLMFAVARTRGCALEVPIQLEPLLPVLRPGHSGSAS